MNRLKGEAEVAKDKSISHRGIMLGSIACGKTTVRNFLKSADCLATIDCFRRLGVKIEENGDDVTVYGVGINGLKKPDGVLNAENSGTTTRLLSGILAGCDFQSEITGDESLKKRPMKRIIEPLSLMGADIESDDGKCPLKIKGGRLKGIEYSLPVPSAQLKSAIILAALNADGETVIYEKTKSRDHTERMLKAMGADISVEKNKITVRKTTALNPIDMTVPCDISSAAFFMVGASILEGSDIILKNVGLNETRSGIIDVLVKMGGSIEILNKKTVCGEEIGDIHVKYAPLRGTVVSGEIIPRLIDEIPIIAVAASVADGETIIKDAGELRVKESDRIKTILEMLTAAGVKTKELEDGFIVYGNSKINGATYASHKDHRIAMSAKILSLLTDEPSEIIDYDCVNVSFPDFQKTLEELLK